MGDMYNDFPEGSTGYGLSSEKELYHRRHKYSRRIYLLRRHIQNVVFTGPKEDGDYDDHLRRFICYLKLDYVLSRFSGVIDDDMMNTISFLLRSPDRENITVAEEIIDSIYNPLIKEKG